MALSDLEIAHQAKLRPIQDIAAKVGLHADDLECYGKYKAKITYAASTRFQEQARGKLILVTAINPTPAGEGKTTVTIGLGDALSRLGKKTVIALREPSLGPVFGVKGGATGGGYAQVGPNEEINLHFTGDFHAITSAHNLLAACLDNHIYHGNALRIHPKRILWRRVMDMNDRQLRNIISGDGGTTDGVLRHDGFDITVASEIMACFCLARDLEDLKTRMGNMVVAYNVDKEPVYARDIGCVGAMAALLAQALQPNLVQTLEGTPALIHGGPFANIAHGCNSVIATDLALKMGDYVVTEAGFGADLGAEKFLDIKCRYAGLNPGCAVVVATLRALKYNGGVPKSELNHENIEAIKKGLPNLLKHVHNLKTLFGLPVVVAINRFVSDTEAELQVLHEAAQTGGFEVVLSEVWARGGEGGEALAKAVLQQLECPTQPLQFAYPLEMPIEDKIQAIAQQVYGAKEVSFSSEALSTLKQLKAQGYDHLPICMAKTQYSLSDDPKAIGCPKDFTLTVRQLSLSAGAGFVVAICGTIMRMPGLPKVPAANHIDVSADGVISGLF